jgi:hypothetical protein
MSMKEQEPLQAVPKKKRSGRRTLLKSALLVLGASALIQPSGGVLGLTQDAPKKGDTTTQTSVKGTDNTKKKQTAKKGTKKKKYEDTKKEGRR